MLESKVASLPPASFLKTVKLARFSLPGQDVIVNGLGKRDFNVLVRKMRKFVNFDCKYNKSILDIQYLQSCKRKQCDSKIVTV